VVYRDRHEAVWPDLLTLQPQVIDYVRVIGLELEVDEAEGYAFLKQGDATDGSGRELPRLIQRRPLSYPVSLLCMLLRKKLVEADAGGGDVRVVLSREQIVEMMRVFLPEQANEARLVDRINTHINKVVELGFLRRHSRENRIYEVRRIIKAMVNADWLARMDQILKAYRDYATRD
ncbi:MAG: DUF4194 domain-containing protein, partial [Desulfosarcina sp.]|nr:DUF4194 domain-containing protein [Desulfobacterales bacterium]